MIKAGGIILIFGDFENRNGHGDFLGITKTDSYYCVLYIQNATSTSGKVDRIGNSPDFTENCINMALEMVYQNYNHPSMIIWAYMNEVLIESPWNTGKISQKDYFARLCDCASRIDNAIKNADISYIPSLMKNYPYVTLGASGMDVGLPDGQMGNSEVGHLNIGAGRIVYQELTRITKSIKDGDFFENNELLTAIRQAKQKGKKLHTYGLLSDGGVHSHIEHLFALIKMAKKEGLDNIYIHCFLDGRDVPPRSGADYIKQLKEFLEKEDFGAIASVMGRYYAMDRDNRWERIKKAYNTLTLGEGEHCLDAEEAVRESYVMNITDEFVLPHAVYKDREPVATIDQGDSIIFFNFRPDRARELTRAFIFEDFDKFERKTGFLNPLYVGMTQYDATFKNILTAFKPFRA